jgi:hypothetical protein
MAVTGPVEQIPNDSLLAIHADLNADIAIARNEAEMHQAKADMARNQVELLEAYRLRISQLEMGPAPG